MSTHGSAGKLHWFPLVEFACVAVSGMWVVFPKSAGGCFCSFFGPGQSAWVRRDANEHLKREQKDGRISEDDLKKHQARCQELTDKNIQTIDEILKKKEEEIMEV